MRLIEYNKQYDATGLRPLLSASDCKPDNNETHCECWSVQFSSMKVVLFRYLVYMSLYTYLAWVKVPTL